MGDAGASIFISYSHVDSAFVDRLEADLRTQGFAPWVDREGLVAGLRWRRELQEAVEGCQVLLIVLSPEAVTSPNVQIEYDYALDLGKIVIPLYYQQCTVPMELRAIQWVDFRQSYEQGLNTLVHNLRRQGGTQAGQAQGPHPTTQPPPVPTFGEATPTSQQGDDQDVSKEKSRPEVERPWNVPFARNPFFTGRAQLLEHLHEQLSHSHSTALNQSAALSGLGGIGKTQTAIEYAYRYRDEYTSIFWVRADSRETLIADYVAIARLLSLPGNDAQDQMEAVNTVKHWLQEHEGWLLILDNADDLSLLPDFLPRDGKGHLLLTTRAQATGKLARSLAVEKLEFSEGIQLLLHRAKVLEEDEPLDTVPAGERKAAQQLVEELDGLPLALDQAGAYIEETECSLADYLALYTRRRLALLNRESSLGSDYPHTVASTWALSFAQVEQADAAAADLLRLCAFLHPDAIPEAILTEGAAELGSALQEVASDPLLLNDAIQLLRRYSLVKRDPQAKLLNIHRLVQVVLKESLDAATRRTWAERTVRVVNRVFPQGAHPSWEKCELLLPHALICAERIEQFGFTFPEAARLLHATGDYLLDRRQLGQAERLLKQALSLRQQVLGAVHGETAETLTLLAAVYTKLGKYTEAGSLLEPALADFERALGLTDPRTADILGGLAAVYLFTGRYVQAELLDQRALAIYEQTLGPTHPYVGATLDDLALLYQYQGKYAQAEPLFQRSLTITEQAMGAEHSETLVARGNLAVLFSEEGKYAQAEELLQRVLSIGERVLGAENTFTIYILLYLGQLSTRRGEYEQAANLLQRAHTAAERLLGPKNDWTLRALLFLADLCQAQQQDTQAASLYQQALSGFEQVLGPEHPRVAETLTHLAQLTTRKEDYAQAESLLQRALAIDEKVLGPEHTQTASVLDAQGYLALLQGKEEEAASLLQRALAIQEQALGSDHPDVAQTLEHLAKLSEKQGKQEEAKALYSGALSIREQVLGAGHPDTIATREAKARIEQIVQEQEGKGIISQTPPSQS